MFDVNKFISARQVRVMCDALLEASGGDDVEAAIDSVTHPVSDLAVRLGADATTAALVGRYWALDLFYGFDPDGVDPVDDSPRYLDEPTLAAPCAEALRRVADDLRQDGADEDDFEPLWAAANQLDPAD